MLSAGPRFNLSGSRLQEDLPLDQLKGELAIQISESGLQAHTRVRSTLLQGYELLLTWRQLLVQTASHRQTRWQPWRLGRVVLKGFDLI